MRARGIGPAPSVGKLPANHTRSRVLGRIPRDLPKDAAIILFLLVLPILFFWPVTLGGKTLLPADNLYAWQPWKSYAAELGVGVPHNALLSDLLLENYVWKRFIVSSLRAGELPLWNPYILAGVPFLAAGQHSALYPLSVLFYLLPIPTAYGWFAVTHLFLAGLFTYILGRTLRIGRAGSTIAATTFMFGGFMLVRQVFPMIIAAAVWLPLILAVIERILTRAEKDGGGAVGHIPDLVLGALAFGMVFLAGHPEMYYYVSIISGSFALWRLVGVIVRGAPRRAVLQSALILLAVILLGLGLGSGQWVPLLQAVRDNFRQGAASLSQVLGWAYPLRRVVSLLIPDFFGNPSHHAYFDLFRWQRVPATVNALGQPTSTIYWGIKNYVEGASYVGTLPLLLALIAILHRRGRHIWFFALVALTSILFVFGSPIYALVYALPGLSQVHSPFRWVYAYGLCVAILAGMGVDALWRRVESEALATRWRRLAQRVGSRVLPRVALVGGVAILGGLGISLLLKDRSAGLAERAMHRLALAPTAFADGRMFYSYQFRNLLIFGLALLLGGVVLSLQPRFRRSALWSALALLVVLGELFVIGKPFFPATDPALLARRPPAVEFLKRDPELYRITTYVGGSEKTFNANAGMLYDIADARGYDSIIPRRYAEYMGLIQPQSELPYNRIAPIFDKHAEALDSPLLDLLNVKYVLTHSDRSIPNEGYTLVYDGEIRIYRNEDCLPRAFLVPRAVSIPVPEERHAALRGLNPRQVVILEEPWQGDGSEPAAGIPRNVQVLDYGPNEVSVLVDTPNAAFLVLADSYAPGWLAFMRPAEAKEPSLAEQELHIYRADGNFRAVRIPPGRNVVRFVYSPNSVKFGLYVSFMSGVVLALSLGLWAWRRFYREPLEQAEAQRVTKNALAPITLSLVNKVIDMAFAMLMLRILGPADAGEYYFAIVVISWFDIFTQFGLNTLLTREVAKKPGEANRYFANTVLVRMGLCLASVPIMGLFFLVRQLTTPVEPATVLTIILFGVALVPSNVSATLTAVFNAHERMEIPAAVTTLTTLLKIAMGAVALAIGAGYIGLASVSILVNVATVTVLYLLARSRLFQPHLEVDWSFQREMLSVSYPLMLNHLLATLFFKVAVLLLEWQVDDPRAVGWYSTAYKYLDAVNIIPAYFTLAIFPLMSRYAATAKGSLLKAYRLAIKLLLAIALPGALIGWALSHELISILGGSQYLPYAANILRVVIWYMPFGFINSVTQYVLIALDRQRFLTRAFVVGVAFNVVANLILINRIGFMASPYVAVASEVALFIPFYVGIRKYLSRIPWLRLAWKQVACALPMALLFALLPRRQVALSILAGLLAYGGGLALLRVFDPDEREAVRSVLPLGWIREKAAGLLARPFDYEATEK